VLGSPPANAQVTPIPPATSTATAAANPYRRIRSRRPAPPAEPLASSVPTSTGTV
jgi:hypothetical protein